MERREACVLSPERAPRLGLVRNCLVRHSALHPLGFGQGEKEQGRRPDAANKPGGEALANGVGCAL